MLTLIAMRDPESSSGWPRGFIRFLTQLFNVLVVGLLVYWLLRCSPINQYPNNQ